MYNFDGKIKLLVSMAERRAVDSHKMIKSNGLGQDFTEHYAQNVQGYGKKIKLLFNEIITEINKLKDDDSDYHEDDSQYASWHDDPGIFGTH